jgi:hypothetical protein
MAQDGLFCKDDDDEEEIFSHKYVTNLDLSP